MGNDLSLYKNKEYIAGLGRAYHFEVDNLIDFDYSTIENAFQEFKGNMLKELVKNVAYAPKSKEEMDTMVADFVNDLEYYTEEMEKFGKLFLISYMLADDGVEVKSDWEIDQDEDYSIDEI
jgi:hypothetical protein